MIRQLCYSVPQTATFISLQVLLLCFLLKVKNSQENLFKESYFKKWLFKL